MNCTSSLPKDSNTTEAHTPPNGTQNPSRTPPYLDSFLSELDDSCYTELYPSIQSYAEKLQTEQKLSGGESMTAKVCYSPVVETVSRFKPASYCSSLMPRENKPLDVGILQRVKTLLDEVDPRTAARHITKADCKVARILEVTPEEQSRMGAGSGMELITLPHGQQLRRDLLERFQTMAILFAVHLLGCTGSNEERASVLQKIIQIAAELKSTMGNMFGFATVMRALELPQVSRLEQTWTTLRQQHTEAAILYEKNLRPYMKRISVGKESSSLSNTTVPHVVPLLTLLEKSTAVGEDTELWGMDGEMDVVMFHLGAGRTIAQLGSIFRSNTESKLQGFQEHPEVLELFLTDFQMRLLWGCHGAQQSQAQRYAKYNQVLTALSNQLEPAAG